MNEIQKYPITYRGNKYTITLIHQAERLFYDEYRRPEHYVVCIYKGTKKWYSSYVFTTDIEAVITDYIASEFIDIRRTYKEIVNIAFEKYQKQLDKEAAANKELQDFYDWDGNLDVKEKTNE